MIGGIENIPICDDHKAYIDQLSPKRRILFIVENEVKGINHQLTLLRNQHDDATRRQIQLQLDILKEESILQKTTWKLGVLLLTAELRTGKMPELVLLFGFDPLTVHMRHEHIDFPGQNERRSCGVCKRI